MHTGAAGCICLLPVEVRRQLPKRSAGVSASLLLTGDEVWPSYSQQVAFGTGPRLRIQSSKYTRWSPSQYNAVVWLQEAPAEVLRAAGSKRENLGAASGEGGLPAPWGGHSKPRPACRGQDIGFLTLVLLPPLKTAAQGPNLAVHFMSAAGKRRFLLHAYNRLRELGGSPAV